MADAERKSSSSFMSRRSGRQTSQTDHMDGGAEDDMNGDLDEVLEEPDFNDPPDYVDRVGDDELLGDLLRSKPKETDGTDSVVIVDNIPQVPCCCRLDFI